MGAIHRTRCTMYRRLKHSASTKYFSWLHVVDARELAALVQHTVQPPFSQHILDGFQDLETTQQISINRHNSAGIVEFATVVGCREDGHELTLATKKFVPIFHHLMCPNHQVKFMFLEKLIEHIGSECERHASIVGVPAGPIRGIAPQEVDYQTLFLDFQRPTYSLQLFECTQIW